MKLDERDQSIERLLRQSFATPAKEPTAACLDGETVAAWLDGGLSGPALEMAQSHVADCARCQAIAGGIIRSEVKVPVPARPWWSAWLVPVGAATAAAAAVVLWVVVPGGPRGQEQPAAPQATPTSQAKTDAAEVSGASASPVDRIEIQERQSPEGPAAKDAPVAAAPAVASELRRDAAARLEADKLAPRQTAPAQAPPPAAFEARELRSQSGNAAAMAAVAGAEIVSPDPAIRWRTLGSGLEYSSNGGSSWDPLPLGTTAVLLAGSAPATTVCWIVGRGGVVLLTTDGRSFSRVPFPEMTDLSAVRAIDGRSATVTAPDGRQFATADAGATWVRR